MNKFISKSKDKINVKGFFKSAKEKLSEPDVKDLITSNLLAILTGVVLSGIFLLFIGKNPIEVFWVGIINLFGSKYTIGEIFVKTTPLIFTGLSFAFTYKANLYNIGAQGQFYMGAIIAVALSLVLDGILPSFIGFIIIMLATALVGAIYGGLIGLMKAKRGANEFLISMMSTYIVIAFMNFLLRTSLRETSNEYSQTDLIEKAYRLPIIINGTRVHLGFLIALLVAVATWYLLFKTSFGFRVRAVGHNKTAAVQAGINSDKMTVLTFAISGAFGAFAGFLVVNGVQFMVIQGFYGELGALGIGIAILANGNPIGVIFASMLFGAIQVLGNEMAMSTVKTPPSFTNVMIGFIIIFVIVAYFWRKNLKTRRDKSKLLEGVD